MHDDLGQIQQSDNCNLLHFDCISSSCHQQAFPIYYFEGFVKHQQAFHSSALDYEKNMAVSLQVFPA